jgi:hypothetical protein
MGNNARCKDIRISNIKVKMFDGVVRTLTNVKYVRDLKKNLISSGKLVSLGYGYLAKDRVMKVTKVL